MSLQPKPKTTTDILALPEGPFGVQERTVDGRRVMVPVMSQVAAFWPDEDDPMWCVDEHGDSWTIGLFADGRWFRKRLAL